MLNGYSEVIIHILITGGAGFIGSNLTRYCIEQGHTVTVLDDLSSGHAINISKLAKVRFIKADIRNVEVLNDAARESEIIFHLAASVGNKRSIEHPQLDADINVIGTLNVLETARLQAVRKVVFSSSAGIFGELKTLPIREDHPQNPNSPYGVHKLAAEKLCLVYRELYGMEVVVLRYFNVFGVNQRYDAYGNVIPIFANRLYSGLPIIIFGDGEQTRDFINVRDVVQANYKAGMAIDTNGVFNIGSGTQITINLLAQQMVALSGTDSPIHYGPPRPGDVRDSLADISAAQAAFDFHPLVEWQDGLREYLDWLKYDMQQHKIEAL